MDTLSPTERSARMGLVRGKDTAPELLVRRLIHGMGYRYRTHRTDIPGKPDIVFPGRGLVIFVHGCFWHRHSCVLGHRTPKSRVKFWTAKLEGNKARDRRNRRRLRAAGWGALVIWECQLGDLDALSGRIKEFLGE